MEITLRDLTVAQLNKAVTIKERIETLEKELTDILGGSEPATTSAAGSGRRKMSAAARAKISAAAKARWAKVNAGKPTVSASDSAPKQKRRPMSAAAKAKISAAAKARWAKVRAGK
jgi:hypothetical protein